MGRREWLLKFNDPIIAPLPARVNIKPGGILATALMLI
jgi:hypothetical protein